MTVLRDERELEHVRDRFRSRGCRWTSQRELIVRTALSTHDHFTADELLAMCRGVDRRVSRATVYRTVAVLEQEDVIAGLDKGDGVRRFEHVIGHPHHDHMVCTRCGAILEFRDERIESIQREAASARGFSIENHSLRIYGRCRKCRKRGR
ncbi:MAG: Fur family transcriptional regulator [Planctomycetota bacterium]